MRRSKSTRVWKVGSSSPLKGTGAEDEEREDGEMEEEEAISAWDLDGAGEGLEGTI